MMALRSNSKALLISLIGIITIVPLHATSAYSTLESFKLELESDLKSGSLFSLIDLLTYGLCLLSILLV